MKVLLLEDDAQTRDYLQAALVAADFTVDACDNGLTALQLATEQDYGVYVLDRMVPGMDGLSVLRDLRSRGRSAPALFLTAIDGIHDRVEGLDAGADDYLVKPFAAIELVARVRALLRRMVRDTPATRLKIGDLEIDLITRRAERAGKRIDLQGMEFRLLEFLMRHSGETVTRTMLHEHVWSFHFDPGTNVVESNISRLRAKIDRGFSGDLIHTVRGLGYCLEVRG